MRLRVFHLIKSLGRGGAERLLVEGLLAADRRRFTFGYGYFLPWKDALVAALRDAGAEVTCFSASGAAGIFGRVGDVARYLRRWRPDVIHAHLPLAGVVARAVGRLLDVPVVYTEHNVLERYHPATRAANLATWSLQAKVIAVSEDVAASARRHAGTGVPIEVVKNGVSLHRFQRDVEAGRRLREALGIPERAPVVGTVAVFRAQKRLDHWLQAAALFLRARPDARFLLVGDGPLRQDVERWRQELGLDEAVILPGLREDVRPFLSAMDAYLMSSSFEGLPVALLEAMASEIPPVVTRVGGMGEVVIDEENGRIVKAGDPAALARALEWVLADEDRRATLGTRARAIVAERFSMDRMQRALEDHYAQLVRGQAAA